MIFLVRCTCLAYLDFVLQVYVLAEIYSIVFGVPYDVFLDDILLFVWKMILFVIFFI